MTGLPEDIDLDEVYGLFENVRFGGGKVANLQTKDGVTFITFKDEAGALGGGGGSSSGSSGSSINSSSRVVEVVEGVIVVVVLH